jgi:ribosomal protein S18 acetylase RimI-like enzyme
MIESNQLLVREARPEDLPTVHSVTQTAYAPLINAIGTNVHVYAETPEQIGERLADGWTILLAEISGQVVGAIRITEREGELYIGRLAVIPEAQHCGIGRALMAAAEERGHAWGLPSTRLGAYEDVAASRPYYERLGYQIIERIELRTAPGRYFFAMRKPLHERAKDCLSTSIQWE